MTETEREALPEGPHVKTFHPYTEEDIKTGKRGRGEYRVEFRQIRLGYFPDDIFAWQDKNGRRWCFGQWRSGQWFKQPA